MDITEQPFAERQAWLRHNLTTILSVPSGTPLMSAGRGFNGQALTTYSWVVTALHSYWQQMPGEIYHVLRSEFTREQTDRVRSELLSPPSVETEVRRPGPLWAGLTLRVVQAA